MFSSILTAIRRETGKNKQAFTKWFSSLQITDETEAKFEIKPFRLHKLDEGPSNTVTVTKGDALNMYRKMQTIRRMEIVTANLYREKIIRGFCHLSVGQEACAVGMKAAMRPIDRVITAYRIHGWCYLMRNDLLSVLGELAGKGSGCCRGKSGSMHMYGPNLFGGNAIVGAQVPIGTGIALAAKYLTTGGVCLALYGDGAANQGQVFESYNIAKLWNLPCIYICENNGYGMSTSIERASACTAYYTRGDYVPGIWVDGTDVLAVKKATEFAIEYCTNGKGPIVMETVTYRYFGHSMSDPEPSYRSREEIQEVRQTRDPITCFRKRILSSGLANEDELKKLEKGINLEIDVAISICREDKEIGLDELTADVYSNPLEDTIRGVSPWDQHPHKRIKTAINKK